MPVAVRLVFPLEVPTCTTVCTRTHRPSTSCPPHCDAPLPSYIRSVFPRSSLPSSSQCISNVVYLSRARLHPTVPSYFVSYVFYVYRIRTEFIDAALFLLYFCSRV